MLRCRVACVVGGVVVALGLGACSSDDSDDTVVSTESTAPTGSSSDVSAEGPTNTYVVEAGDTLSGIAASYGLTLDELVDLNDWDDGADHAIFPGDEIALHGDAVAVPTTRPPRPTATTTSGTIDNGGGGGSATTSTATTTATTSGGYRATGQAYAGPNFGGSTDPIVDPLPDGVYWSFTPTVSGDRSTITFELMQQFNGDECLDHFGTAQDSCASDIGFESATTTASMSVGSGTASVLVYDGSNRPEAFRITSDELARLLAGQAAADDAPDGYAARADPFVVTVLNGSVIAADQIFIS